MTGRSGRPAAAATKAAPVNKAAPVKKAAPSKPSTKARSAAPASEAPSAEDTVNQKAAETGLDPSLVKRFNSKKGPPLFLISLKAGGTGLNLVEADYVYLVDPWWNPAVENQAIGRAHRIGSDEPVTAYKFLTQDTIEQKLDLIINSKMQLFDQIINEEEFINQKINLKELLDL